MSETETAAARPRFLVDASLIRLGKYLRCAGYDAEWDAGAPARVLAERAEREGRVFVTRSTRMGFEFGAPDPCVTLASNDPRDQFQELVSVFALDTRRFTFTRCIRCNIALERVADPATIRARVEPAVFACRREFFTCPRCATVFWHGSHVENTCRKLGLQLE